MDTSTKKNKVQKRKKEKKSTEVADKVFKLISRLALEHKNLFKWTH